MPSWAVIEWMLTSCPNQVTSLALFYDWIFFNPSRDNFRNLEPAALVMVHSMKAHPQITATLLEVLTNLVKNFHPASSKQILEHVTTAFKLILYSGVVPRLSPLLFNTKLKKIDLRKSVMKTFCSLYFQENEEILDKIESIPEAHEDKQATILSQVMKSVLNRQVYPEDSKVQDDIFLFQNLVSAQFPWLCDFSILPRPVFVEDSMPIAESLSENLSSQFVLKKFPSKATQTSIQVFLSQPIFSLFNYLMDPRKDPIMELLANLHFLQPRLGYCLLLFLIAYPESEISQDEKITLYTEFCQAIGTDCSLADSLVRDLTQCQKDDVDLFVYLVPHLYHLLPRPTLGNIPLLYLIVSCVDGSQIHSLVSKIVSQQLILLHGDTCQAILETSLTWETFEQTAFWLLYNAHELPFILIQNVLPKLSAKPHAEALTHVMFILKREKPSVEVLSKCLTREPAGDDFLSSLCCFWMKYCPQVLAESVATLVTNSSSQERSRKRKADQKIEEKPMTLQLLGHVTPVMGTCQGLFKKTDVMTAFIKWSESCLQTNKVNLPEFFESLKTQK